MTVPVWHFYQSWFPRHLSTDRGLSQEQLKISRILYAAAGVGSLLGGWLSGQFVRRGVAFASSRLRVMLGCACLMPHPLAWLLLRSGNVHHSSKESSL
ncbi:MAG TPA: hypothetical protein PKM73_14965 [Verrucomicrobiota bacterium]|nr:hypothetical protein [Verrucomicrobiota bacterium]HNU52639.1 hypothetical protein [Verrucomicrobiota bacterium]